MLNIKKTIEKEAGVLTIEGRLDTVSAPALEQVIKELLPELTALTLDFEKLDYISSAGLRVLLSAQKAMNKQGSMTVTHVNKTIMEIFEITGFSNILTIR